MLKFLVWGVSLLMLPILGMAQDEPEVLFFDAFLQKYNLNKNIDIVTSDYESFYLNLDHLNDSLGFSVIVDYSNKRLSGWYLKEANRLDMPLSKLGTQGDAWIFFEGELYVRDQELAGLLGLEVDVNTSKLIVFLNTIEQHPMIAKLERQKKYRSLSILNDLKVNYPIVDDKYSAITHKKPAPIR